MRTTFKHLVTETAPADPEIAAGHFAARLAFETDPADVHADLAAHGAGRVSFVLVDTRAPGAYAAGHLPGAINLPAASITEPTTRHLSRDRLLVTYCWSVSCNAATKGAARLAALGFPVKELTGGIAAWQAEGYPIVTGAG